MEDNPGDVRLTREALDHNRVSSRLHVVQDGFAAISFLRRTGEHGEAPRPDLVLLDLNLPGKDGREVLAEIKADHELRPIPVVVLTTSSLDRDVAQSYSLNANCYVTKPIDLEQFIEVVQSIERFWLTTVTLPGKTTG